MMNSAPITLLLSLSLFFRSFSFQPCVPVTRLFGSGTAFRRMSVSLAQKRRRRKSVPSTTSIATPSDSSNEGELPDFDFDDNDDGEISKNSIQGIQKEVASSTFRTLPSMKKTSPSFTPIKRGTGLNANLAEQVGGNVEGLDEDVILEAMRGRAGGENWLPPRSIQDTISDRSLEKFMDFDTMIQRDGGTVATSRVELPDFDEVITRRKQREAMQEGRVQDAAMFMDTEGMGKKAAKAAQRRAAALQREAEVQEQKSPFEDVNIFKLLENGAWVGIALLVLWEIYINSPFFDRAAPLIPVVYDDAKPPGM